MASAIFGSILLLSGALLSIFAAPSFERHNAAEMVERRNHYGMTKNDFDYVRRGLMQLRRDRARRANVTGCSKLDEMEREFNTTTSAAHISIDDIRLSRSQVEYLLVNRNRTRHYRIKRATWDFTRYPILKWSLPIPYVINMKTYTSAQAAYIDAAFQEWHRLTCVKFQKRQSTDKISGQYLYIQDDGSGCASYIGAVPTDQLYPQVVSLQALCLDFLGVMAHELGHALGLFHEQSRPDRDDYVTVLTSNITPDRIPIFDKSSSDYVQTYGIPYDYGSVMHYDSQSFLLSNLTSSGTTYYTLLPSDITQIYTMGQTAEISFYDAKSINAAYCSNTCQKQLACQNGGYTDPKNCSVCRCPDGHGGTVCEVTAVGSPGCTPLSQVFNIGLSDGTQCVQGPASYVDGFSCAWDVRVAAGMNVSLWFTGQFGLTAIIGPPCLHWVEIRYLNSHVTRGQRFCSGYQPQFTATSPMTSQSNTVKILFNLNALKGQFKAISYYGFTLCFKAVGTATTSTTTTPTKTRKPTRTTPKTITVPTTTTTPATTITPTTRTKPTTTTTLKTTIKPKATTVPTTTTKPTTKITPTKTTTPTTTTPTSKRATITITSTTTRATTTTTTTPTTTTPPSTTATVTRATTTTTVPTTTTTTARATYH